MRLPYGISDFGRVRRDGYAFIDKTGFIPLLESAELGRVYLVFLRPRRFGKSTLISMLEHYYDLLRADAFEGLFGGLEIGQNPTAEHNRYLVLRLEFTGIATDRGLDLLRETFMIKVQSAVDKFARRYQDIVPELAAFRERLREIREPASLLHSLLSVLEASPHPVYVLIDEYDNFTNDLIARGDVETYQAILHASGFVREFYKTIKEGTTSKIARIFMTGVSPVTLDDLTSGFNIAKNITLHEDVSELAGFSVEEVAALVDGVLAAGQFTLDREQLLEDLREYYNGYLFSHDATTRVYNPDMVLYFLSELVPPAAYPRELLDMNVRTDYGRLRRMLIDRQGRGRSEGLEQIRQVIQDGHIDAVLHTTFPLERAWQEEYFLSMLYYLGLLTIEAPVRRRVRLTIPNAVIAQLYWENLRTLLEDLTDSRINSTTLINEVERLAFDGELEPFLRLVHTRVLSRLSNRDFRRLDEKALKMVLLTWLAVTGVYEPWSEAELGRGYADLVLLLGREYRDAAWHCLIELKYLKKDHGTPEAIEAKFREAETQLERYLAEPRLRALSGTAGWKALSIVYVGLDQVYWREKGTPTRKLEPEEEED